MTKRTELEHRRRELQAAVFARIANRALSRRTSGLDRVAKGLLTRQLGGAALGDDPELEHLHDHEELW